MKTLSKIFSNIAAALLIISLLLAVFASGSAEVRRFVTEMISPKIRSVMTSVSNYFDFSVFELLALLTPFWIFALIAYLFRGFSPKSERKRRLRVIASLLFAVMSLYILTLGISDTPTAVKRKMSQDDVRSLASYLSAELKKFDSPSYPPLDATAEILYDAFDADSCLTLTSSVPRPKCLRLNTLASRMGILAHYSFLTSEVCVNTEAPSYTVYFSLAHEMAHLFGASREAEANFYAYRAAILSSDPALVYSARLCALEYAIAALADFDLTAAKLILISLSECAKRDIEQYREFYLKNSGSLLPAFDSLNNIVIKLRDPEGSASYDSFIYYLFDYHAEDL